LEDTRVKAAIRTDFILSAEIIAITLGAAETASFITRLGTMVIIGLAMTIIVYGLVLLLVKADDFGIYLINSGTDHEGGDSWVKSLKRFAGIAIIRATPFFMKTISLLGTFAMFTVGGGLVIHGSSYLHHMMEAVINQMIPYFGVWNGLLIEMISFVLMAIAGVGIGLLIVGITSVSLIKGKVAPVRD
jgi:predicted DNA repair protein MutK